MIRSILFTDDDPVTVMLMKTRLELNGYAVTTAKNGREALEVLAYHLVDLVITDVVMPEMDGVDLYQALKADPRTRQIPIMVVTDETAFIEAFTALGEKFFITKSSPVEVLLAKIREIEQQAQTIGSFHKFLVGGLHQATVERMTVILRHKGFLVSTALTSADILAKAFVLAPDVVLVDAGLEDKASVRELVRALRCFAFLQKTRIILFTDIPSDQSTGGRVVEALKAEIQASLEAGATQYIGRFDPLTFAEQLPGFGFN